MSRGNTLGSQKVASLANRDSHSAYEKYKENLHAIFDGLAPLPSNLRENTDAQECIDEKKPVPKSIPKNTRRLSQGHAPYSLFTEALKKAATPEEIRRATDALKEAKHEFPMDEDLISKALTYPSEEIVLELLEKLESLFRSVQPKNPRLLLSRLDDAAFSCKPGAAREKILSLKAKLKG